MLCCSPCTIIYERLPSEGKLYYELMKAKAITKADTVNSSEEQNNNNNNQNEEKNPKKNLTKKRAGSRVGTNQRTTQNVQERPPIK